ncbi:hypothetical protein WT25_17415 [Burkholderia territorii]|uniref:antitoxin VbhA family protein n=1 Tax=Burkholderia territorii TaxID=1503055 RepID=UPI000755873A|nr:antitoxin VbhA family protein [Burkholderia territorii]KVT79938.1 hypothetical protein WT25_17415 [Burkholderia territorii]KWA07245.1 hypothetical protein WT37_27085 [Burkholderia territorii]
MAKKLNSTERQRELRERFRQADAISRLEGYEPDDFEEAQKERLIVGEITAEEFIAIMAAYAREGALGRMR